MKNIIFLPPALSVMALIQRKLSLAVVRIGFIFLPCILISVLLKAQDPIRISTVVSYPHQSLSQ